MSTVKSGGSSRNGRESHSKRLGAKLSDGQFATAGSIIYRQRGTRIHPGKNAGKGGDDTIFAMMDGYVKFEQRRNRTYASVYSEKPEWQVKNEKASSKPKTEKKVVAPKQKATTKPTAKKAASE